MNFFQHQDQSRKNTRWLVFLFLVAVFAIVAAVDIALVIGFGFLQGSETSLLSPENLNANLGLVAGGSLATLAVIGIASLFKTASLRSGGGAVARALGGRLVEPGSGDPLERRLYNVVEEIALASGVPVPEVYLLEQESGINAFAAGFSPSDAAIAVTRGTLEKLNRNELQGVIAHEYSHIFNGDMRLNIRLMGALFGILVLALIGRKVLRHTHYVGRSRNNNSGGVFVVALALMIVGYIGLFFGRWIKSAVSRQREYLADASAVQFTRDPHGIAGALKKIAIHSSGSFLDAESEEVSHMLFGPGERMSLFDTHPPLMQRIQRIEPGFDESELQTIADRISRKAHREQEEAARLAERRDSRRSRGGMPFDADSLVEQIGNPEFGQLVMAAALAASIPATIRDAAHSTNWVGEVLFYTLLDENVGVRELQLLAVAQKMGSDSEQRVQALVGAAPLPTPEQRLPLLEMALPSMKRLPPADVQKVLETIDALIRADAQIDVFEYLLARVVAQYLWEASNPNKSRIGGNKRLSSARAEAMELLAVLAGHGHGEFEQAQSAFRAGLARLNLDSKTEMPVVDDWTASLDRSLAALDSLRMTDKQALVLAMIETVTADGLLVPAELELMRAACAMIHVPMPVIPESETERGSA